MLTALLASSIVTPDSAHLEGLVFGFLLLFVLGLVAGLIFGKS
jgi:hypothetical protein